MDSLAKDVIPIIINYLDDKSFIHFIMTNKYFNTYSFAKDLIEEYNFSEIVTVLNKYKFTKIFYDKDDFNIDILPKNLNEISFKEEFNGNISQIYSLPNIKIIRIGRYFTNLESIKKIPNNIQNKFELIAHTISNFYFKDRFVNAIKNYKRQYLPTLNLTSMNKIKQKYLTGIKKKFKTGEIIKTKDISSLLYQKPHELINIFDEIDITQEFKQFLLLDFKKTKENKKAFKKLVNFIDLFSKRRLVLIKDLESKLLKLHGVIDAWQFHDYWKKGLIGC